MTPEVKERIEQIRHGNVPEGYKKTAVGISPDDWQEIQLSKVVDFLDDRRIPIKESERIQGEYPYYGASGVIDHVADYIFDGEYILLGEDGANIIERSTPLAFRVSGKCWINNHAHVLSPKDGYHIDYLTNYLESLSYAKYNSGTAQPKLNQDTCQKIPVVCGSYTEQVKIADILSAQNTIMELKEKLLAEKQRQKKYMMQQLLIGKKRLPGYDSNWQNCKLHQIAKRIRRRNSIGNKNVLTISAQYGLINQSEFFNKEVASDDKSNYYLLKRNDFAYNKSYSSGYPFGAIKRLTRYDMGVVSPLYICFEILGENVSLEYMEQYFEAGLMNREIQAFAQEGARNHGLLNIAVDDLFNSKIVLPSLEEQRAIAEILTAADREIELLRQDLEQEKQKKKALMQLLLTGIVRVDTPDREMHA